MARVLHSPALGLIAAAGLALAAAGCAPEPKESPTRGRLEVVVSESHAALLGREAALFNDLYPEARVTTRGTSTREAFIALLTDSIPFVVVDRPPNAEERAAIIARGVAYEEVRLADEALGVFVNAANRLDAVTREQAAGLLTGGITRWSELPGSGLAGPVRLITTGRNSGAYELAALPAMAGGGPLPSVIAADEADVLARVAADQNAVGLVSVAAWKEVEKASPRGRDEPAAVGAGARGQPAAAATSPWRPLALIAPDGEGVPAPRSPHQANVYRGLYPWRFTLYAYYNPGSRLAAGFNAFVCSAPGQKLILDAGLVPVTMPMRLVHLR